MNKPSVLWLAILVASISAFATTHNVGTAQALMDLSACATTDTVVLTSDIDMKNQSFSPMCTGGFTGIFDGNGYTISNLTIHVDVSKVDDYNIAFIAVLGGVLKNLTFVNPDIDVSESNNSKTVNGISVAVAVGVLRGGSIENVHVTGGTVENSVDVSLKPHKCSADAGGIVGTAESGTISESSSNLNVSGQGGKTLHVGGICGNVTGDVTLASISYEGSNIPIAGAGMENVTSATKYGAVTINEKGSVKSAVIDGDYTAADIVKITSDIAVSSVTLNRTFVNGAISTLYVPFNIAVANVGGASVYKFKTVEKSEVDGRWKFKVSTTDNIVANTPYIILPSATQVTFNIAESVTLNTSIPSTEKTSEGKWEFKGTYEYMTFAETSEEAYYVFAGQNIGGTKLGEFVKSSGYANPMRAYLIYHKNAVATKSINGNLGGSIPLPNEIDIEVENEKGIVVETGTLNTVTGAVRMDCWFDLKGRRLNSKPTVQGTYYKNGKKVVIK